MTEPHPLFAPTARLTVPTIFVEDHVSRDLDVDENGETILTIVRRIGSRGLQIDIDVTFSGLLELFDDALHYSTFDVEPGDAFMTSIRGSARSTVISIRRQVPTIDDDRARLREEGR